MSSPNFIDQVKIFCASGDGGAGSTHFHRAKFVPRGGPDGGNGGRGGNVVLKGNENLWTLLHLRYTTHIKAGHGKSGTKQLSSGASGNDVTIEVPLGTVVKDAETDEVLLEVTDHNEAVVLLHGGRGGMGNAHFKSATRQTPRFAQPGEPGEEGWFVLELKVLADVGLVGFPNAGKSTLLSVVSAAKPEIADYPFTTLTPNLGVVRYSAYESFIMADIPGIIEGAHEGKGLGLRFLRHIERNSILLFLISSISANPLEEYHILLNELELYAPELLEKERIVGISKTDLIDAEQRQVILEQMQGVPVLFFSAVSGDGISVLKDAIWAMLHKA